jgi:hypothetical protein
VADPIPPINRARSVLVRGDRFHQPGANAQGATMRLQTFRDDEHSRHFDLIGKGWVVDLVSRQHPGDGIRLRRREPVGPLAGDEANEA